MESLSLDIRAFSAKQGDFYCSGHYEYTYNDFTQSNFTSNGNTYNT